MKKKISAIFLELAEQKDPQQKIAGLKFYDSFALRSILQGFFDPRVKFLLPKGDLPEGFSYSQFDEPLRLYTDARKLYLFVEGGSPIDQSRREQLFLDFVGGLNRDEADLIVAMKDKKWPYKGLTEKHVREAFPGLLP